MPRPARHQCGKQRRARIAGAEPREGLLHVEQADIVLASLANDDALAALLWIGHDPLGFLVELALQVLGIGRYPYRCLVALGPQPGGREIAKRLAEPCARLGK